MVKTYRPKNPATIEAFLVEDYSDETIEELSEFMNIELRKAITEKDGVPEVVIVPNEFDPKGHFEIEIGVYVMKDYRGQFRKVSIEHFESAFEEHG